jgi:hypothetical protein
VRQGIAHHKWKEPPLGGLNGQITAGSSPKSFCSRGGKIPFVLFVRPNAKAVPRISSLFPSICRGRDSNPYPLRDQILSLARLPISPPRRGKPPVCHKKRKCQCRVLAKVQAQNELVASARHRPYAVTKAIQSLQWAQKCRRPVSVCTFYKKVQSQGASLTGLRASLGVPR